MMNLYETIGVQKDASPDEIKKAFRDKSKDLHPDKGGNHDDFVELNFAYQILIDEKARDRYDKTGSTEKDDFDKFFQGFLEGVVWPAVMSNPNLEETHMIEHIKSIGKQQIQDIETRIKEQAKELKKLDKFLSRLRPNQGATRIQNFMSLKQTSINQNIEGQKGLIKNLERCIYEIGEYGYEVEKRPDTVFKDRRNESAIGSIFEDWRRNQYRGF